VTGGTKVTPSIIKIFEEEAYSEGHVSRFNSRTKVVRESSC